MVDILDFLLELLFIKDDLDSLKQYKLRPIAKVSMFGLVILIGIISIILVVKS